jgi:hypothetical protein
VKISNITFVLFFVSSLSFAQDSLSHSPTKAALLSAVFPGAGQIYNKKFWKLPFVYGGLFALGRTAYEFNDIFVKYSQAIVAQNDNDPFTNVSDPNLVGNLDGLKRIRDQARRNRDYFVILAVLYYGITVVDATVDAHFKDFDVSPNLSLRLRPSFEPLPNLKPTLGLSLALKFTSSKAKKTSKNLDFHFPDQISRQNIGCR